MLMKKQERLYMDILEMKIMGLCRLCLMKLWTSVWCTFLCDEKGIITNVWEKVKVPGHADEVLAAV